MSFYSGLFPLFLILLHKMVILLAFGCSKHDKMRKNKKKKSVAVLQPSVFPGEGTLVFPARFGEYHPPL